MSETEQFYRANYPRVYVDDNFESFYPSFTLPPFPTTDSLVEPDRVFVLTGEDQDAMMSYLVALYNEKPADISYLSVMDDEVQSIAMRQMLESGSLSVPFMVLETLKRHPGMRKFLLDDDQNSIVAKFQMDDYKYEKAILLFINLMCQYMKSGLFVILGDVYVGSPLLTRYFVASLQLLAAQLEITVVTTSQDPGVVGLFPSSNVFIVNESGLLRPDFETLNISDNEFYTHVFNLPKEDYPGNASLVRAGIQLAGAHNKEPVSYIKDLVGYTSLSQSAQSRITHLVHENI